MSQTHGTFSYLGNRDGVNASLGRCSLVHMSCIDVLEGAFMWGPPSSTERGYHPGGLAMYDMVGSSIVIFLLPLPPGTVANPQRVLVLQSSRWDDPFKADPG